MPNSCVLTNLFGPLPVQVHELREEEGASGWGECEASPQGTPSLAGSAL